MAIYCDKSYVNVVSFTFSQSVYCTIPTLLAMRWDDQMLTYWDEVWWMSQALWHSIMIILAWWYLERSSALSDLGSSNHGHVNGWRMSWIDDVDACGSLVGLRKKVRDFIMQLRMAFNLKHELFYFWYFPQNVLDHVCLWQLEPWKTKLYIKMDYCYRALEFAVSSNLR